MKLGLVIGRVTLSQSLPALTGARWLLASPFAREHFDRELENPGLSSDPSPVVYDALGAGVGQVIGYEEGAEAAQPFDQPTPIDAISVALVDEINFQPLL